MIRNITLPTTNVYCSLQAYLNMNNNKESDTTTMAGRSADDAISGADNNKLERLLIQMNTMTSTMEKALWEIPKACAGAIHDCLHLVSSVITKGKANQNSGQPSSSQ